MECFDEHLNTQHDSQIILFKTPTYKEILNSNEKGKRTITKSTKLFDKIDNECPLHKKIIHCLVDRASFCYHSGPRFKPSLQRVFLLKMLNWLIQKVWDYATDGKNSVLMQRASLVLDSIITHVPLEVGRLPRDFNVVVVCVCCAVTGFVSR